jgi:hypothetical protein
MLTDELIAGLVLEIVAVGLAELTDVDTPDDFDDEPLLAELDLPELLPPPRLPPDEPPPDEPPPDEPPPDEPLEDPPFLPAPPFLPPRPRLAMII